MSYATRADVESLYGIDNVRQWSNLENDGTEADADRIASALAWADRYIDNRFRNSPYAVPLVADGTVADLVEIRDLAARLAAYKLITLRPTRGTDAEGLAHEIRELAEAEIRGYLSGKVSLPATRKTTRDPRSPAVVGC